MVLVISVVDIEGLVVVEFGRGVSLLGGWVVLSCVVLNDSVVVEDC